jgi:RNA polymerase sigma-70 factor (ECF subfamily)
MSARTDVVRALEQLPPAQRKVLVLHYVADRSVEDVARELQLPLGTVKSHLSRGRARLAALLSPEVVNDER